MTDHHDFAEVEGVDECCKVLRINDSGVSGTGQIAIRIIIASAIRNRPIMLGKPSDLSCPISSITKRPVDENNRRSFDLIHVMQRDAIPVIDGANGGIISV